MIEGKHKSGENRMAPIVMKSLRTATIAIWSLLLAACALPSVGGERMGLVFNEIECDMTRRDLSIIARVADVRLRCDAEATDGYCHFGQDNFTHGIVVTFDETGQILLMNQIKDEGLFPVDVNVRSCGGVDRATGGDRPKP